MLFYAEEVAPVYEVDAISIALENIGVRFANSVIMGAFVKATGIVAQKFLEEPLKWGFGRSVYNKMKPTSRSSM
jgi:Pyruvate/2-oxoacid:ferredoxin oxidoreductase gamma subunit